MKSKIFNSTKQYTGDLKRSFKNSVKLEEHANSLMYLAIFITIISLTWIFISYMIPANPAVSQYEYINSTAFYSTKFSNNFNSYSISLTGNGIALCVWMGLSFIVYALTAISHVKRNKIQKVNAEAEKAKIEVSVLMRMIAFIVMLVLTLALFAFILIPPISRDLANAYHTQYLINFALSQSGDEQLNSLKALCASLGISVEDNANIGSYINAVNNYNPFSDVDFTPWYNAVGFGIAEHSSAWVTGIVVFSVAIGGYFLTILVSFLVARRAKLEKEFSKETMKAMLEKYKENRKERQAIRKNKKELLDQENELLKNLYEMDQELAKHNQDDLSPIQRINQRELEEKIAKNNELKKQLEELNKQKVELKKESAKHSKVKATLNKVQETNTRQAKAKKQEIAVPDKELEEIFKSLDID